MKDFFNKIFGKLSKKQIIIICSVIAVVIIGIVVLVIALSGGKEEPVKKVEKKKEEVKEVPKVKIVDVDSKTRPYAVMINNIGEARVVQSGLPQAYLVYEILAEGGITRFLALFKDVNVDKIGSVRSARHYYLDYAIENDAIFVHWGYSPQAAIDIPYLGINNINGLTYEGRYFYRDNPFGISSEHTGFTNTDLLKEAAQDLGYPTETDKGLLLNYSAEPVDLEKHGKVEDANKVNLVYSNYAVVNYEYDSENKVYKRFNHDKPNMDYPTGEQITAKNIIVYKVETYSIPGDTKGRIMLNNWGTGEGYYISEGKMTKINWSKQDRYNKTIYTLEDGEELTVNDGNTFIQILPDSGSITVM